MKNIYNLALPFFLALVLFSCTKDTGTVTVNYLEATAIYGDMDDIRALPLMESGKQIEDPGKIYIGEGFVLIGEEGEGIHVINNQDRENPTSEVFIQIPGNLEYFVSGQYLYAESYYDVLKIDISNPFQASLIARSQNAIQKEFINDKGETLVGFSYEDKTITLTEDDDFMTEILDDQLVYLDFAKNVIPKSTVPASFAGNSNQAIGTINRITKAREHIYIVSNNNMIILDDNDFSKQATRIENVKEDMETIFPYQNTLFIGSKTSMSMYDITIENQPTEIYDFEHARSCDPVLPYNDLAFVTLRTADFSSCPGNINALLVIDLIDLSNPTKIDEIQQSSPYGMSVIDNLLFVGNGEYGLNIYDIKNKENIVLKKNHSEIVAYDILPDPNHSGYIFIAGSEGMNQYSLGEDLSLQLTSSIDY